MTKSKKGKAAIAAGAVGSAAIAAAMLYMSKRKSKSDGKPHEPIPSGEKPETD